jgi:hypothetical protein
MAATLMLVAVLGATRASAASAQSGPTVGDLAARLYGSSMTPAQAMNELAKIGVAVSDPKAPLTQGTFVKALSALGAQVTTKTPESIVDIDLYQIGLNLLVQAGDNIAGGSFSSSATTAKSLNLSSCVGAGGPAGLCIKCCLFQGAPATTCVRLCSVLIPSPSVP